ncbi:putative ADF/Cofilin, ADF-H/Gelsolin-like domain-containing protein [Rosa chinensis]|uniref:Putative ADF/Cofilin, ADF-H/Gelsolin-like domain-containing protein n=1 Tax=Rosa chinensis TaxID=74649 RepID=A0A2P6R7V8_ROSCH|nr:putative ADF/Cofilin, ADF-H/Gelsolin-like domain-containing protein [Rosa chinensis]
MQHLVSLCTKSAIFKIEEEQKQVIVEATGDPTETYEAFTDSFPTYECCYAVFNFDLPIPEGVPKRQILFIALSLDTSREGNKKIYASAIDSFKRELDGIQIELEEISPSDIYLNVIRNCVSKHEP